jgi:predicted GIY-YIG superfamily endonuclease
MVATHKGAQSLPSKAGVYIIRCTDTPSTTLYVGIASNLKSRLNSQHHIIKHCRDRGIEYTIDYELESNEKKRKKREHQLISELNATLNDGGISSEFTESEPLWQNDIDSLVSQLVGEASAASTMESCDVVLETWKRSEFCQSWLRTAWENLRGDALDFLVCSRKFKGYSTFINEINRCSNFSDYKNKYKGDLLDSSNQGNDHYKFWIEKEPAAQGVGSAVILDDFHKAINGENFDLDSVGVEERFLSLLPYLIPSIANQWESFKRASSEKKYWHMGDITEDFCDHALMWAHYNRLKLFHPDVPRELLFTKFFLENPYTQCC